MVQNMRAPKKNTNRPAATIKIMIIGDAFNFMVIFIFFISKVSSLA